MSYIVYVSDDNGWLDSCPDYRDVFFGDIPCGAKYVGDADSEYAGGHVEFQDIRAADSYLDMLRTSVRVG